jgi:hypothetical protein
MKQAFPSLPRVVPAGSGVKILETLLGPWGGNALGRDLHHSIEGLDTSRMVCVASGCTVLGITHHGSKVGRPGWVTLWGVT